MPYHGHDESHFVWAIFGCYETQAGRRGNDASGVVVFNPAGTEHRDRFLSPGVFFSLKVRDDNLAPDSQAPVVVDNSKIKSLFYRVCKETACIESDSSMVIEGLCFDALSMLSDRDPNINAKPGWLAMARDLLRAGEKSTLSEIAGELGIHPTHFVRAFKKHMRCTPGEFRRFAKLQVAASKMAEGDTGISAIAADAGYSDQSHFTKHFRQAFGITPRAYREAVKP